MTRRRCDSASHVILPGVGAFADAMAELRRTGLDEAFVEAVRTGKPCLGVCLGLQLLFDRSSEDGEHAGLGLLPGRVVRFAARPGLKVPHMGWNTLRMRAARAALAGACGPSRRSTSSTPITPRRDRTEDVAADGRLSRPVRGHRLARQPDGLPVPPREEPATWAWRCMRISPVSDSPGGRIALGQSVLAMFRVQGYIEFSLKKLCRSGERSCK